MLQDAISNRFGVTIEIKTVNSVISLKVSDFSG